MNVVLTSLLNKTDFPARGSQLHDTGAAMSLAVNWFREGEWSVNCCSVWSGLGTWCTSCKDHNSCDDDGTTVETETRHWTGLSSSQSQSVFFISYRCNIVQVISLTLIHIPRLSSACSTYTSVYVW